MAVERNPMAIDEVRPGPADEPSHSASWVRKLAILFSALLSFIVGLTLILFPWLNLWGQNRFAGWSSLWNSPYTRGAVSGLGLVNVCISVSETIRLFRSRRS